MPILGYLVICLFIGMLLSAFANFVYGQAEVACKNAALQCGCPGVIKFVNEDDGAFLK